MGKVSYRYEPFNDLRAVAFDDVNDARNAVIHLIERMPELNGRFEIVEWSDGSRIYLDEDDETLHRTCLDILWNDGIL